MPSQHGSSSGEMAYSSGDHNHPQGAKKKKVPYTPSRRAAEERSHRDSNSSVEAARPDFVKRAVTGKSRALRDSTNFQSQSDAHPPISPSFNDTVPMSSATGPFLSSPVHAGQWEGGPLSPQSYDGQMEREASNSSINLDFARQTYSHNSQDLAFMEREPITMPQAQDSDFFVDRMQGVEESMTTFPISSTTDVSHRLQRPVLSQFGRQRFGEQFDNYSAPPVSSTFGPEVPSYPVSGPMETSMWSAPPPSFGIAPSSMGGDTFANPNTSVFDNSTTSGVDSASINAFLARNARNDPYFPDQSMGGMDTTQQPWAPPRLNVMESSFVGELPQPQQFPSPFSHRRNISLNSDRLSEYSLGSPVAGGHMDAIPSGGTGMERSYSNKSGVSAMSDGRRSNRSYTQVDGTDWQRPEKESRIHECSVDKFNAVLAALKQGNKQLVKQILGYELKPGKYDYIIPIHDTDTVRFRRVTGDSDMGHTSLIREGEVGRRGIPGEKPAVAYAGQFEVFKDNRPMVDNTTGHFLTTSSGAEDTGFSMEFFKSHSQQVRERQVVKEAQKDLEQNKVEYIDRLVAARASEFRAILGVQEKNTRRKQTEGFASTLLADYNYYKSQDASIPEYNLVKREIGQRLRELADSYR